MAFQTHQVTGLDQVGVVFRTVCIVTGVTGHASSVHHALNEIVALHAVFVSCAIGKVSECGLTQFVLL
jgi:hypothetical protein